MTYICDLKPASCLVFQALDRQARNPGHADGPSGEAVTAFPCLPFTYFSLPAPPVDLPWGVLESDLMHVCWN